MHAWLESEEEARLIEEAMIKSEEEDQDRLRSDKEESLSKEAMQKLEDHKCARLNSD